MELAVKKHTLHEGKNGKQFYNSPETIDARISFKFIFSGKRKNISGFLWTFLRILFPFKTQKKKTKLHLDPDHEPRQEVLSQKKAKW